MSERARGCEIEVRLGQRAYPVRVEPGLLGRLGELVAALAGVGRVVLVTDETVAGLYGEAAASSLRAAGMEPLVVVLPAGEEHKTLATVEKIYDAALDAGIDRRALIVALGGGVVGDVAAFAAATLLRGIRVAMVPTSLLAQVDSSVGGKTGVNRPQGKNLVGAFHQPVLVAADPQTLATLPEREYRAGLAEVVKMAAILDATLFERLEHERRALLARDPTVLTPVVARCVQLKAEVVERDEKESELRRILNFGHTVGHALEQATGYSRFLHGEAVAIGMVAAARLCERLGTCGREDAGRIERLLEELGLPTEVPADVGLQEIERAIGHDKKAVGEKIAFVAITGVGACRQLMLEPAEICDGLRR